MSDKGTCDRCRVVVDLDQLNVEARIHHGAREVICLDRKACERRIRSGRRRA